MNAGPLVKEKLRGAEGGLVQVLGSTTERARRRVLEVRAKRSTSSPREAERSLRLGNKRLQVGRGISQISTA